LRRRHLIVVDGDGVFAVWCWWMMHDPCFEQHERYRRYAAPRGFHGAEAPLVLTIEPTHAQHINEVLFGNVVLLVDVALQRSEDVSFLHDVLTASTFHVEEGLVGIALFASLCLATEVDNKPITQAEVPTGWAEPEYTSFMQTSEDADEDEEQLNAEESDDDDEGAAASEETEEDDDDAFLALEEDLMAEEDDEEEEEESSFAEDAEDEDDESTFLEEDAEDDEEEGMAAEESEEDEEEAN